MKSNNHSVAVNRRVPCLRLRVPWPVSWDAILADNRINFQRIERSDGISSSGIILGPSLNGVELWMGSRKMRRPGGQSCTRKTGANDAGHWICLRPSRQLNGVGGVEDYRETEMNA